MFNKYLKPVSRVFCGLISALLNKKHKKITIEFVAIKAEATSLQSYDILLCN